MNEQNHSSGNPLHMLEAWLDDMLGRKAPQLPEKWREVIVKITPWITLIIMLFALPALLVLLGLGTIIAPVAFVNGVHTGSMYSIGFILAIISLVLEAIAIPGLFKRSLSTGWRFAYWAILVSALSNIISLQIGSLIFTVLFLYVLFQI